MAAASVLLVDDDQQLAETLADVLTEHHFSVHCLARGSQVLPYLADHHDTALVLLDLMLPDMNGLTLLPELQQRFHLPVIMLTGLGAEADMVVGLEMGADDYITKPCQPRVLVARVKAVLRRSGSFTDTTTSHSVKANHYYFGSWHLDPDRGRLYAQSGTTDEHEIPLTQGEFMLLKAFLDHPRRVLSREQLLNLTHSDSLDVFDRTIDVLIMRLRRKLEANPHQPQWIRTVRGLGYSFAGDVTGPERSAIANIG